MNSSVTLLVAKHVLQDCRHRTRALGVMLLYVSQTRAAVSWRSSMSPFVLCEAVSTPTYTNTTSTSIYVYMYTIMAYV